MEAIKIDSDIQNGCNLIKLPNSEPKELSKELEVTIKQWLVMPEQVHILDMSQVTSIDPAVISQLLMFQKSLKRVDKLLHVVHLKPDIKALFMEKGILKSLGYKDSLDECFKSNTAQTKKVKKMDIEMLNPFIEGAAKAFEVQIGLSIKPMRPSSKKHAFEEDDAIAGILSLDLPNFKGQISICFSEKSFCSVYSALLGEEISKVDEESCDAASELLNMIYGHAKTVLNKKYNLNLQPAIPKAVLKPKPAPATYPVLVVPFQSDSGPFRLEIQVE